MKKIKGWFAGGLIPSWISLITLLALALFLTITANVHAHEPKSKGQSVYVPVYSAIGFISSLSFDLAVTLSFRNVDGTAPITVNSAIYYDTSGKKKKDLLAWPYLRCARPVGARIERPTTLPRRARHRRCLAIDWQASRLGPLPPFLFPLEGRPYFATHAPALPAAPI